MPSTMQHLFGPGSLEMLRLDLWTRKAEPQVEGVSRQFRSKLVGQYDVYCGNGSMHRIDIKVDGGAWSTEAGRYAEDLCKARNGDEDAARRFTETLIEMELEDWSDPCEEPIEVEMHGEPAVGRVWGV